MRCVCDSDENEISNNKIHYNLKGCINDKGVKIIIHSNDCVGVLPCVSLNGIGVLFILIILIVFMIV